MVPKKHSATLSAKPDRTLRRWVFCIAGLVGLVALFYLVEDWRGRRAWENCVRDLEATGIRLNWDAYIPPPVPDEENVFKAPYMQQWFVKGSAGARGWPVPGKSMCVTGRVYLAELRVVSSESKQAGQAAEPVLRLGDTAAAARAVELVHQALGPSLLGAQNSIILARRPETITPVRFAVEAKHKPTAEQVQSLFLGTNLLDSPNCQVQVQPGDSNAFFLFVDPPASCYAAADYLEWNQQFEPDLEIIREALKRPHARMDGDYTQAFAIPIPNFVAIRSVVQMLAQRAQCHLLLGEPDAARSDLTLLNDMRSLLEAPPTHRPMTLVATMINVAVTGLYAEVVADGLRLGAWREVDLKAIQDQLARINLVPYLAESLANERAATCHTLLTTSPAALNNVFSFGRRNAGFWDYIKDPESLVRPLMPRGWIYQNLKTLASLNRTMTEAVDPTNRVIDPKITESANQRIQRPLVRHSPYNFLVAVVVPNFARAAQNLARTESRVRQALLACALERYRLAEGRYPESLEQLVPGLISEVPQDVIKDAQFKYRAPETGGFLLYSVGWDEQDNGGLPDKNADETDWVWRGR